MQNVSEILRSMEYAEEQELPFRDEDEIYIPYDDYPQYESEQREFMTLGRKG